MIPLFNTIAKPVISEENHIATQNLLRFEGQDINGSKSDLPDDPEFSPPFARDDKNGDKSSNRTAAAAAKHALDGGAITD